MDARHPIRRRRRPRTATVLVAVLLSATAAGCGVEAGPEVSARVAGGSGAVTTPDGTVTTTTVLRESSFEGTGGAMFLRDAARATSEVTTQKLSMTMSMTGVPAMGDVVFTYEGAFDNAAGRGHMTVDMGDLMGSLGGGSGLMEWVIDGDTVYVKSDLFSSVGDGKPWVTLQHDDMGIGELGVQSDPTAFLDFLEGVGDDLETVGREEVRGVATTHVRTDIDMMSLLAEASAEERADYEDSLRGFGGAAEAFGSVPVDAWVDDDGYVRRFTMAFDMSGIADESIGELGAVAMTLDLELYDFNEPVDIVVPDPAEVSELDLWGSGGN